MQRILKANPRRFNCLLTKKIPMYVLFPFLFALIFLLPACKSRHTPIPIKITPTVPLPKQDLTEEQVITIAKNELVQKQKKVQLQVHYYTSTMKRIPCTQYDVDGGVSCSEPEGGAPYGYKNVPQDVLTCCRQMDYPLYNSIGTWSAEYSSQGDNWTVTYEFNADNLKYHFVWTVDDNSSSITEKGLSQ